MPFDGSPVRNEFVALLRTARDLITNPKRHIRSALFKDKYGHVLDAHADEGETVVPQGTYAMCLDGALIVAGLKREQRNQFGKYFIDLHGKGFVDFNDSNTHASVMRAVDRVIDHIESRN